LLATPAALQTVRHGLNLLTARFADTDAGNRQARRSMFIASVVLMLGALLAGLAIVRLLV
jgi:hypothetical protein